MGNKSWKTTVAGAISALGVFITTQTQYSWAAVTGQVLTGLGTFLMGMWARDNDKTSADVGAVTK